MSAGRLFTAASSVLSVQFLFYICDIEEKCSFNLDATLSESEMCSLFINSSSGKLLELEVEPLLTALKCFQMLLVLFEVSMEFVKCLRFAFLMRVLVLFLYFLYSDHSLLCLYLSPNLRASPLSGTYQAGRRENFTRYNFMGTCLSIHCMITECHAEKSSSTVLRSVLKCSRHLERSAKNKPSSNFLKQR